MPEHTGRRVECPTCHKTVALRKDGMLWHHYGTEPEWPGSPFRAACPQRGLPPEPDAPLKRRRSSPDWADLREMARNAGCRFHREGEGLRWEGSRWDVLRRDEHTIPGDIRVYLDRDDTAVLWVDVELRGERAVTVQANPTPAEVLTAARLVGLGGAS